MDKFIAEFDPLVALEAEYAAVVSRARTLDDSVDPADDQPERADEAEKRDDDRADSNQDDDEDDGDDAVYYAPLAADSDEEHEDEATDDEALDAPAAVPVASWALGAPAPPTPMDEARKQTIKTAMQSLQLRPPPWATDAVIGDDDLIALVQQRLRTTQE